MARTKNFNQEEVLDKAVELFWRKGYNATSASDLVRELGLSRSSLYDTYGDKRTLFINSLQRYRARFVGEMIELVDNSSNIEKTLKQIFSLIIEQDISSKIPKGCLMVNSAVELSSSDSEIARIVEQNQKDIESSFEKAIIKGQENGTVTTTKNPKNLAKFFYNSITGLRVSLKYNKFRTSIDEIVHLNLSVLKS